MGRGNVSWCAGLSARAGRLFRMTVVTLACTASAGCMPGLPGFGIEDAAGEASFAATGDPQGGVTRLTKSGALALGQDRPVQTAAAAPVAFGAADRGADGWTTAVADSGPASPRPEPAPRFVEAAIEPPAQSLQKFYAALASLAAGQRKEPVTILHIGDDHVAADHLTSALRAQFQSRFGDAGRGMLPPGVFPASGIKFDRGGTWSLRSSAQGDPGLYGLTGLRMETANKDAWVRLTHQRGPFDWLEVTFGTGPGFGTAVVAIDGEPNLIPTASSKPERTIIRVSSPAREAVIRPRGDGPIALLSFAVGHDRPGIRYVNLGVPGATAATPGKWNLDFLAADLERLRPDLVILGYGTREGFTDKLDLRAYEVRASVLVQQLKELAPQASFFVIGPPDGARLPAFAAGRGGLACRALGEEEINRYRRMMKKEDERLMRWHAPPNLDAVRDRLRTVASAHGAYFWDWSRMMGGSCSVHAWAHAKPPLASADHVMLTERGAERSARALFIELMNGFETYKLTAGAAAASLPAQRAEGPPAAKTAQKPRGPKTN